MKSIKNSENEMTEASKRNAAFNVSRVMGKAFYQNHLRKIVTLTLFLLIGISFQSCSPAYVEVEPTFVEGMRPMRPSNTHIWIDGDWVYNRSTHAYIRNSGYWTMPNRNRTYFPGRWEKNERGHRWVSGRWQRS